MKHLATLFILFFCLGNQLSAQSLSLFTIDASGFPVMRAKLYAFDAAGVQHRPSASELTIFENGKQRSITSVNCPPPPPPFAISSVLTVDVSGSMNSGTTGTTNIDLAKAAARAWIQGLPAGRSECALSSFDDRNYINQDFTTDRSRLLNALATLTPVGGTNYDMGLLEPLAGSLPVSLRGKFKRVIVFLSDGLSTSTPNTLAIINEAKKQNCMIFSVTLGLSCPQSLKDISIQTGGQWYENVTTTSEAEVAYRKILQMSTNNSPCEITWTSEAECENVNTTVSLQWQTQATTASYQPPSNAIAYLNVKPNFITLGKQKPATQRDTTITLTAQNADFMVTGISRTFGSADFSVINTTFPLFIPKNSISKITLRFAPTDSGIQYASFEIITDKCAASFSANGGFPGIRTKPSTLHLTNPNAGEKFVVGSDTVITWNGIAPSDTVSLEFSADNGKTWNHLTTKATGLKYLWKNIPKTISTECLIRVKLSAKGNYDTNAVITLLGHSGAVTGIAYSPDGSRIATASNDKTAKVWDANTGTMLLTLLGHTDGLTGIAFSPDGSTIATSSTDVTTRIWDVNTGGFIKSLKGNNTAVLDVAYSLDGSRIATAGFDNIATVWNANTGLSNTTLVGHSSAVNAVVFSPDGSIIVTASTDWSARVWDVNTGANIHTLSGNGGWVRSAAFSPDGSQFATTSDNMTARIWNTITGGLIRTLTGHQAAVYGVDYSSDKSRIATASADSTAKVWSANTGALLRTLVGHTAEVLDVAFSPDNGYLATSSNDSTAKIWELSVAPLQEDISDTVFSIVMPVAACQDIDMLQCLVGAGRDSIIMTFVQNKGTYPFRVESIQISGTDASSFSIVSGFPPFTVAAGRSMPVEFHFSPTSTGIKTAQILIYTQHDTLRQTITGLGIAPVIAVSGGVVDFGKVFVNSSKDTFRVVTVINIGSTPLTVSQSRLAGPNLTDFSALSSNSTINLQPGDSANVDLQFSPTSQGRTSSRFLVDFNAFGSPATIMLFGEGIIKPSITATQDVAFDSSCVGTIHTRNAAITNDGADTMQLLAAEWITNSGNTFSTTLTPQILPPDSTLMVAIDFLPTALGVSSGSVRWIADKDTAFTSVSGSTVRCVNKRDTARTTVIVQDITAKAGEKVNLSLKLQKSSGMQLTDAPTDWYARIHYNKSMLFTTQSNYLCNGTTDSCALELTGVYNPKSDELLSIPCIATLGTTDHSSITIDEFRWTNGWILTDVITQNGTITITGTCEDGGVRLFIPSTDSSSLSSRPNPAQDNLQIQYGLREPLTVTLELLTMTGQIVQTILKNQAQAAGQYTLTSDLSVLGNGVYLLRLRTNRNILTTRVDVVK